MKTCAPSFLTISDRCAAGTQTDLSGPAVVRMLNEGRPCGPRRRRRCRTRWGEIAHALRHYAAIADLIVTAGGTGLALRDVTPEATRLVCDRLVEGLAERMRIVGLTETPLSPLSRAVCGCVGATLIVNLPGSPAGRAYVAGGDSGRSSACAGPACRTYGTC